MSGGSVQTVCDLPRGSTALTAANGGAWNQDGSIVFAGYNGPLLRVPAMGGMPQPATALAKGELSHVWPQLLPDGRHVLYLARSGDAANHAIYVQELGSSLRVQVLKSLTRAMWSPPPAPRRPDEEGYLLFIREGTLFAQRMDPKRLTLEGEALAVAQEVVANEGNGRSTFAVSRNGVLAYRSGASGRTTQLTWRGRDGKVLGVVGPPGELTNPSLSPDEKSVALLVGSTNVDTWVVDLATGVFTRMTRDGKASILSVPAWSPDSQRLAVSQRGGAGAQEIDVASGKVTSLGKEAGYVEDWTPDGRSILCNDPSSSRLWLLSLAEGPKLRTIIETPYRTQSFRFTPDGKYVVYTSNESGPSEVYVASFPSFAVKRKVSTGGALYPVWANGGKEIFYRANDGTMMEVEVRTGSTIEAGIPKPLFKFGVAGTFGNQFGVTADGKRFLINEPVQTDEIQKPEISLVLNWAAEIKQQ
ncbi:MAG: hypothetical protein ACLQU1_24115 [Bryobacteraceae bacterium]